jgi:hypothetical protein
MQSHGRRIFRTLMIGLALAGPFALATLAPARADDDDWRRREWREREHERDHDRYERREREWREHEWREHHPYGNAYPYQSYSYAPPPVIYTPPPPPPPVYYAPAPSLDIVIPLHIR